MLRTRLLLALLGSLLLSSASWANGMGYVDCSKYPDSTQVLDQGGKTNGVVAILPCGERFTVLVRGEFYSQIQTKDGKVGYILSYLITTDTSAASKPKASPAPAPAPSANASASAAVPSDMTVISRGQTSTSTVVPASSAVPTQSASASNSASPSAPAPQPAASPAPVPTASARPTQAAAPAPTEASATAPASASSASASPASAPAQTGAPAVAPAPVPAASASASSAPAVQPEPAAPVQPVPAASAPAATVAIAPPQPAAPSQSDSTASASATSASASAAPVSSAPATAAPAEQPEPSAPAPFQPATTIAAPVFTPKVHPSRQKYPEPYPNVSNVPMFELFAGYGFTRFGNGGTGSNLNGALGSFGFNVMSRLQIIGDASYNFVTVSGTKLVLYGDHFGPRFFLRSRSAHGPIPFVEGLVGGTRMDSTAAGVTTSQNGITYKGGGGVDLNISRRLVVRIVDADYYRVPFLTGSVNNYSASAGIVFRFGGSRPEY